MKVSQAVDFHRQCHRANSKKNTIKTCEFVLTRLTARFGKRDLASISQEEVLEFLLSLTKGPKTTNRLRKEIDSQYLHLSITSALTIAYPPEVVPISRSIENRKDIDILDQSV
jgi:hypothetical protein